MSTNNAVASNAFNAHGFVDGAVDPRTGQYTMAINLPTLNANNLCGPDLPLALEFNPINRQDSGFGVGWSLPLTEFRPANRILALSSGETYKVTGTGSTPQIAELAIETFRFFDEGSGRYRVVYKGGRVEVLQLQGNGSSLVALPVEIHSPGGHVIYLTYQPLADTHRLHEVRQTDGTALLRVSRYQSTVSIDYLGTGLGAPLATFMLQVNGNQLERLELPTDDQATWRLRYETLRGQTCLARVASPLGAVETIEYLDGGHLFPGSAHTPLPRVSRHVLEPGRSQPAIESKYSYSDHNFLGFGASGLVFTDDGLDNLYKVSEPYTYHSTQTTWAAGAPGRSIQRVYNRYHSIVEQVTRNASALLTQSTHYPQDDTLPFDLQVPQCQLPFKQTVRWSLVGDPTRVREDVVVTRFDAFGNPVEEIDVSGARQTWEYYPAMASEGCPADPYGFTHHLKEHRRHPAASAWGDEPIYVSRFTYVTHPSLAGESLACVVLATQVDTALLAGLEQPIRQAGYTYINAPGDSLRHGRDLAIEETYRGHVSTTEFTYELSSQGDALLQTQTIRHTLDGSESALSTSTHLFTGLMLQERTADGLVIVYEYDRLQRLSAETVMPDTAYAATRRYRHHWTHLDEQFASHYEVDALGVETEVRIDGLGRTIERLRQRADGSSDAAQFQLMYSAQYGDNAQLLMEVEHDWLGATPLRIEQRYEYDDWETQSRVIDSTGIAQNSLNDPIQLTTTEWQDGMAKTATIRSRAGKPMFIELYASDGARLTREQYAYDGHQQLRTTLGTAAEATEYRYDLLGRATHDVLPDRTELSHEYAAHSEAILPVELDVLHSNRVLPPTSVGTQAFDGLGRLTDSTTGGRTTGYCYRGSRSVADRSTLPSGQILEYDYDLTLTDAPTAIKSHQQRQFAYHPVTGALTRAQSPEGLREYEYDGAGHLSVERSVIDGQTREIRYLTSPAGRVRQRADFSGLTTDYAYDDHGRLQGMTEGLLAVTFSYNDRGQRFNTRVADLGTGNTAETELAFDEQGREILRTQRLSRASVQATALTWAADGQLRQRELHIDGQLSLTERFAYDPRGRLILQRNTGPDLPVDQAGLPIMEQRWCFDGLDNLLQCTTVFADGSRDDAEHFYDAQDSCQLRRITHTHGAYAAELNLDYDANGNLLHDGSGRELSYDGQGRLLRVSLEAGPALQHYRYDAHDQLLGVMPASGEETLRFYDQHQLHTTVQGDRVRTFSYEGATPLGQQTVGNAQQTLLTLCGANQSVMAEVQGVEPPKCTRYSSHGVASDSLLSTLGFNGEVREADTGWYLLGSGYRAYNPGLRCFHSPDSLSPFGEGGINPYAYCLGNPIRYRDPTGHASERYSYAGMAQNQARAVEMAKLRAAMQKSINSAFGWSLFTTIAGTILVVGLTVVTGGLAALTLPAVAVIASGTALGAGGAFATKHYQETGGGKALVDVITVLGYIDLAVGVAYAGAALLKAGAAKISALKVNHLKSSISKDLALTMGNQSKKQLPGNFRALAGESGNIATSASTVGNSIGQVSGRQLLRTLASGGAETSAGAARAGTTAASSNSSVPANLTGANTRITTGGIAPPAVPTATPITQISGLNTLPTASRASEIRRRLSDAMPY